MVGFPWQEDLFKFRLGGVFCRGREGESVLVPSHADKMGSEPREVVCGEGRGTHLNSVHFEPAREERQTRSALETLLPFANVF